MWGVLGSPARPAHLCQEQHVMQPPPYVVLKWATALSRTPNGIATSNAQILGAAGGFWRRLAAAAAAATACGQPAQMHQRLLHTQQLVSVQTDLPHSAAARVQPAAECSTAAPAQHRGFATRGTRASRSAGGRAAPAAGSDSGRADGKGGHKQPVSAEPTAADIEAAERARFEWFADKPAAQLIQDDVGKFVDVTAANIPEAFQDFYASAAARGDTFVLKGGCKGLQEEVAHTKTDLVMYRQRMHDLIQLVASGNKPQLFLDGPRGSGKSIVMAMLAEWGRTSERVVVYVPSASLFMDGGMYHKNEVGTWDTPDAARLLMRTVAAAHATALEQFSWAPSGTDKLLESFASASTVAALIKGGVAATDPHVAVSAAVEVLRVLKTQTQVPVLFVVDDWNALYWVTGYNEWFKLKCVNLLPTQLRLANAVKALLTEAPPAHGAVIAAVTRGSGISSQLVIPRPKGSLFEVPRFDGDEMMAYLAHQARAGTLPDAAAPGMEGHQALMYHLTGGNAREMRKFGTGLLY